MTIFVRSLSDIVPSMFSLDHINYSRWLPVFLHDMKYIPSTKAETFTQSAKGSFAVKKSPRVFSNIGIDQAREQFNKDIKIDGETIRLMDDNSSFLKWSVSGPVIAEMLQAGEDELPTNQAMPHHENTPTFEATFKKGKSAFTEAFLELGNPFQKK